MSHQVGTTGNRTDIVSKDQIHAHEITAEFRLAISNDDTVPRNKAMLSQYTASVRIDNDSLDCGNIQQCVKDPPKQGLAGKRPEVLANDTSTIGFHG
jgi:hypothetical protein